MHFTIKHTTLYEYQEAVNSCHNRICLTPLDTPDQRRLSFTIRILPQPDEITYRTDFFGNQIAFFSLYKEHSSLQIITESEVVKENLLFANTPTPNSDIDWREVNRLIEDNVELREEVTPFLLPSYYIPYHDGIKEFCYDSFETSSTLREACMNLMNKIYNTITFTSGYTTIQTPVEEVLRIKKGVCQDIAHLMIACLRNMGIPAKYVSGYIETIAPQGKEKLQGADASHAWVSVFFPHIGWVEFDPTNNLLPSYQHIVVAYGRDYQDVAPIKGIVFSSGEQLLKVEVDVVRS